MLQQTDLTALRWEEIEAGKQKRIRRGTLPFAEKNGEPKSPPCCYQALRLGEVNFVSDYECYCRALEVALLSNVHISRESSVSVVGNFEISAGSGLYAAVDFACY